MYDKIVNIKNEFRYKHFDIFTCMSNFTVVSDNLSDQVN